MNITFSTDDNTRKYTLTKSENFGYTLSVTRKRTQEELDEMFNSGITKGKIVKEWTTPLSTFHANLDQVADKVVWHEQEGLSLQDVIASHNRIAQQIKETIQNEIA